MFLYVSVIILHYNLIDFYCNYNYRYVLKSEVASYYTYCTKKSFINLKKQLNVLFLNDVMVESMGSAFEVIQVWS